MGSQWVAENRKSRRWSGKGWWGPGQEGPCRPWRVCTSLVLNFICTRYTGERVKNAHVQVAPPICRIILFGVGTWASVCNKFPRAAPKAEGYCFRIWGDWCWKQGSVVIRIAFWQDHSSWMCWKDMKGQDRRFLPSAREVIMNAQTKRESAEMQGRE